MSGNSLPTPVATWPAPVVLDTNVALDWLLFADLATRPLAARIETGELHWLSTASMRDEFADVLARPILSARCSDKEHVLTSYDRLSIRDTSVRTKPVVPLRCRDPDDQIFIDLALAAGARWLFTRDKALLALAQAALAHGVAIVEPRRWSPEP